MSGKELVRNPRSRRGAAAALALAAAASLASPAPARAAEGLWDHLLEKLNVKATPSAPAPSFVERTRPDPAGLGYLPPAVPHKVSPLAVKTPDQIQAQKDALDAAQARQLSPDAPPPAQLAKGRKVGKPAPAAAD